MAEESEPTPRTFTFKPKEFDRVNAPRPVAGESAEPPPAANDVFALQQQLRAREVASGMDVLKPAERPQSKRRRRDYWLLLLAGNGAIVGIAALVGFNIMTIVYAFSGVIAFSIGLTWIMWGVMDRY